MPILEVQRRAVEVGRIRAGEKGARGEPKKLDCWRLTSPSEARLQAAANLWGGKVRPWKDRPGEYELYTETDELPIMLLPGQLPTTWYELWSKGGCQRRCDGQHELISDSSCICNTEEERQCVPHTRLSVLLPDLPGVGSWLLQSNGWNAALELPGSVDLLQRAAAAGVLLPAYLMLQQRSEVKAGQTRRYAVPVIDIRTSFNQLLAAGGTSVALAPQPELGTPINGPARVLEPGRVSVAEGVAAVQPRKEVARRANAAEPIGPVVAEADVGASPEAPDESEVESSAGAPLAAPAAGAAASAPSASEAHTADEGPATKSADPPTAAEPQPAPPPLPAPPKPPAKITGQQKTLLNKLYGELREVPMDGDGNVVGNPRVTIGGLYAWAARHRKVDVDVMIALLTGRDEKGRLHFPPLRDSLTKVEASAMIEGMEGLRAQATSEAEVEAAIAAEEAASEGADPE